jgi:hypothetical protein
MYLAGVAETADRSVDIRQVGVEGRKLRAPVIHHHQVIWYLERIAGARGRARPLPFGPANLWTTGAAVRAT